jgi:hypothetical protein
MNLNTHILALVVGKANKSEKMYVMICDVLHLGWIQVHGLSLMHRDVMSGTLDSQTLLYQNVPGYHSICFGKSELGNGQHGGKITTIHRVSSVGK